MKPEMTAADVLETAADLIETVGWCQGVAVIAEWPPDPDAESYDTAYCAIGALTKASGLDKVSYYEALSPLMAKVADEYLDIPDWNDDPQRTKAEVVDMLKLTAKDLRNA